MVSFFPSHFRKMIFFITKIFISIYIAKNLYLASITSSNDEIIKKFLPSKNNMESFHLLLSKLKTFDKNKIYFEMDSTIYHSNNLNNFLLINSYYIVNLLQTYALKT